MKINSKTKIEQRPDTHDGTTARYDLLVDDIETGVKYIVNGRDAYYQTDEGAFNGIVEALRSAGHEVEA